MTTAATPLQRALLAQLRVLQTTHQSNTVNQYRWVSRHFLAYLQQHFPPLSRASYGATRICWAGSRRCGLTAPVRASHCIPTRGASACWPCECYSR